MTRGEVWKELAHDNPEAITMLDQQFAWQSIAITERLARREAEAEGEEYKGAMRGASLLLESCRERLAQAEARVKEYDDAYEEARSEECQESDDRIHCACVPNLRKRIKELEDMLAKVAIHSLKEKGL